MKKRTSIVSTFLISMSVVLVFFIAVVTILWINQRFVAFKEDQQTSGFLSAFDFFLNISGVELMMIFVAAIIITSLVIYYIATNIKAHFEMFNKFFYDAAHDGRKINQNELNFREFASLAEAVNDMIEREQKIKKDLFFNEKYLQTVLDAQKNIVIVQSNGTLERANQAFFNFVQMRDVTEFRTLHSCISDFFVKDKTGEYLGKSVDGEMWVRYILKNPLKTHKVKILQNNKEVIFEVHARVIEVEDTYKVVLTFHNISELEEQKRALEKEASIDALTRVANRLKFDTILEQQIEMVKRYNYSFCLILFDIDDFKLINDTYGHHVGDNVLIELAMLVKNSMRKSDTFARWGGEEFAIILPQSRLKTAVKIAEKLRVKINHHIFEERLSISCSFGVSEYKKNDPMHKLIQNTDEMLYKAKRNGKNQIQF